MSGKLIGVGVGPGDPELLTLRAVRLIQAAPVLAYTVDTGGKSYARQSAAAYVRPGQEELPLFFSMSPEREERLRCRREAAARVLSILAEGRDVVFISEGDPLLYSTFQHLLAEVPPDVPVEICPGISAMSVAAAAARFPLAVEGSRFIVTPAEAGLGRIREWLAQGDSVALYKAARRLKEIRLELQALDLPCEAVLVECASTADEVITRRIEDWSDGNIPYFSIVLLRPLNTLRREE